MRVRDPIRHTRRAVTLPEVILVMLGMLVVGALLFSAVAGGRIGRRSERIRCANNLKQLGISFRVFAEEGGGRTGGAPVLEDATRYYAWLLSRSNELTVPKVLVCPLDRGRRSTVANWSEFAAAGARNRAISYAAAPDATEKRPTGLLFADRGIEASPPLPPFSYRAPRAVLGDLGTNAAVLSANLTWTSNALHRGFGYVALADGSVQWRNSAGLSSVVAGTGDTRNRMVQPGEGDD